jgi:hypothetical protein
VRRRDFIAFSAADHEVASDLSPQFQQRADEVETRDRGFTPTFEIDLKSKPTRQAVTIGDPLPPHQAPG